MLTNIYKYLDGLFTRKSHCPSGEGGPGGASASIGPGHCGAPPLLRAALSLPLVALTAAAEPLQGLSPLLQTVQ